MIFVMGVTMLKMDRAKAKWRVKLQKAFAGQRMCACWSTATSIMSLLNFSDRKTDYSVVYIMQAMIGHSRC